MNLKKPIPAALAALVLALPMLGLVPSIAFDFYAVESFVKMLFAGTDGHPTPIGYAFLGMGLLALPLGLIVALRPVLFREGAGFRAVLILNLIVVALIITLMVPTWGELASEIYRCDVLRIPNCD